MAAARTAKLEDASKDLDGKNANTLFDPKERNPMAFNNAPTPSVNPEDVPENYVDMAEARMRQCYWLISTSKLRNLLSMITTAITRKNAVNGRGLPMIRRKY